MSIHIPSHLQDAEAELLTAWKRIAELEAERDSLAADVKTWSGISDRNAVRLRDVEAERDRLKAALTNIANSGARQHDFAIPADHVTWTIHRARAALSGEGVTK